jgi:hypothetical protein
LIGVGLDAATVGNAIRAPRAGGSIAGAAKTLNVGEDALRATIRASKVNNIRNCPGTRRGFFGKIWRLRILRPIDSPT